MQMSRKIFLIIIILLLTASAGHAHDWYSAACCSGHDCHPIASCAEIIDHGKDGLSWNGYNFSGSMIHPSQDSQCHVCISNWEYGGKINSTPHCIYIQQGS